MDYKMYVKLGIYKMSFMLVGISILISTLLYITLSVLMGGPSLQGVIRAIVIPAIIAPIMSYLYLRILTQLDLAREALRESEDRYKSIVENSHDGVLIVDDNYRYIYVNDQFCRVLGYSYDEIIGQDFRKFLDNESIESCSENYIRRQSGQNVLSQYEFNVVRKNGETRRVEIKSTVAHHSEKGTRTYAQILDITDRKIAEENLIKSEKKFKSVFENTGIATVIIENDKKISMANTEFEKLSGYPKQEIEGKMSWTEFVLEEDLKNMERYHLERRKEKNDAPNEFEFRFIDKFGNIKNILNKVNIIAGTDKTVASLMDITDIIKAKRNLKESERKFRSITASAKDAIIMMDGEGKVSYWNEAAEKMFGYPSNEIFGKKLHKVLSPPSFYSAHEAAFLKFKETGHGPVVGKTIELTGLKKNGVEFPIELSVSTLKLNGEWNSIGIVRDISDRKELEDQLRQAHKMEAIGTLAGGIAHDFNNSLQGILGYTQMLLLDMGEDVPEVNKLHQIEASALRASELTKQLLTFSRKVESQLRPVDLNREVRHVDKLLRRTIPRMIDIELNLESGINIINADAAQIEQVIMNLGINARDALPDGGKLTIGTKNVNLDKEYCRTHLGSVPGDYVMLSMTDSGTGMDKETLEHIFEPFYTTKELGKGTGLGLAMVYGIVKSHGGYITCFSEPGESTTFSIYFPVVEEHHTRDATKQEKSEIRGGIETILVVDDEDFILKLAKEMLHKFGYTVLTAADGESALNIYREEQHDIALVILDLIMPGMGGQKCLGEILRINPSQRVAIASGYSGDGQLKEALELGAKNCIKKPFEVREMMKVIRDVLDHEI